MTRIRPEFGAEFGLYLIRYTVPGIHELLQAETARIAEAGLEASVHEKLLGSWQQKIERSKAGDQRWGFFTALK